MRATFEDSIKKDHLLTLYFFQIVKLSEELKNHLHACSYNVTKDQEAITTDIKQVIE